MCIDATRADYRVRVQISVPTLPVNMPPQARMAPLHMRLQSWIAFRRCKVVFPMPMNAYGVPRDSQLAGTVNRDHFALQLRE